MAERFTMERARNIAAIAVSAVALGAIVFGFTTEPAAPPTVEERIEAISGAIQCPFCDGESLAGSQAGVARDYRALIAERVEAGASDEEIIADFGRKFGESFILDTSTSVWFTALWVVPIVGLGLGGGVLVAMKRSASIRRGS